MAKRHDPDLYHTQSPLPLRLIEQRRVTVLIKTLDVSPEHNVLEIGVGAGNVLERIRAGHKVGVDISEFLLSKARDRLGTHATLFQMNAEQLAFGNKTFDRVYCTEVLEHVQNPRTVLREMHRVLKEHGVAVVSVPNEALINQVKSMVFSIPGARSIIDKISGYEIPEHMEDEWHLHEFDRKELETCVAGLFKVVECQGIPSRVAPLRWVAKLRKL